MKKSELKQIIRECIGEMNEDHYETEPRDPMGRVDQPEFIEYKLKESKDKLTKLIRVTKITAKLHGNYSGAFTNAVNYLKKIDELNNEIDQLEEQIKQGGFREKIASLFGATYEFCTRVITLVNNIELVLAKNEEPYKTYEYKKILDALYLELTPDLQKRADDIKLQFEKVNTAKVPKLKINEPDKSDDIDEGISDIFSNFLLKIKQWGKSFDSRLNSIMSAANQL